MCCVVGFCVCIDVVMLLVMVIMVVLLLVISRVLVMCIGRIFFLGCSSVVMCRVLVWCCVVSVGLKCGLVWLMIWLNCLLLCSVISWIGLLMCVMVLVS